MSFGGAAGLFLGASFISFVEILYFLMARLFSSIVWRAKNNSKAVKVRKMTKMFKRKKIKVKGKWVRPFLRHVWCSGWGILLLCWGILLFDSRTTLVWLLDSQLQKPLHATYLIFFRFLLILEPVFRLKKILHLMRSCASNSWQPYSTDRNNMKNMILELGFITNFPKWLPSVMYSTTW